MKHITKKRLEDASQDFSELEQGNTLRSELAKKYAELDSPIRNKPAAELLPLYEELFFNICTELMLLKCSEGITAHQRWKMVEPFT